ncbi:protein FAR-RED IMPAIRED RESPONSE 1-like [Rhododendron vialii]|uniref:protein FAR-RED IMPAIRED RESPONSE 1-like n=1 Tax=Rhododendron vialii TaxID=182163 RepID=UPI00265E7CFF|nr:protein FAR-RED IMPAIRED RESPONSE 1-like [Rhododendron vialii]XP_058191686.1 protein FAR-RED IMPAIRED RESPONSE 1-like [Rhododendron vialii]
MTVIFGVALMYDETTPSFVWLFETFLKAMSGKKPFTFFTDQDQAMASALFEVMPNVKHGLCTFHLNQNAMKHLGYLGDDFSAFSNDFNACMFGYEEETELIEAWKSLVKNFKLEDNAWVAKTWDLREKWAHVHMKWSYNAGMRSTQLSESMNAKLKRHLKSNLNLGLFFTYFDQAVCDKRYKEKQATFDSREKMVRVNFPNCPMLLQAAKVYTPPLFDLFHKEFDISTGCTCKVIKLEVLGDEIRCVIQKHDEEREYVVLGSVELDAIGAKTLTEVRCSCRKFESFGILCGHAIRVLSHMNVMEVPVKYILGRWRLEAKSCSSKGKEVMVEENDRKLVISARYRHLCPKMVTLAARASEDDEAYKLVTDTITLLCAQVDDITLSKHGVGASSSGPDIDMGLDLIDLNLKKAKGLKKKVTNRGIKGGKRLKAWHEKIKKRANGVPRSHFSQDGETPYYPQMVHLLSQASCSTQVSEEKAFERAGDISTDHSIHIPMEAELFNDEGFIDFMAKSQPPSQY